MLQFMALQRVRYNWTTECTNKMLLKQGRVRIYFPIGTKLRRWHLEVTNGRWLVSFIEKLEVSFPRRWNELVIRVGGMASTLNFCQLVKYLLSLFSHWVMFNSAIPWTVACLAPLSSTSPRICSNSCSLSRWCYPTISSSATPSTFAFNLSQHQDLFQWAGSSHQVVKVMELQLQRQFFQWIFRVDFLRIDWFDLLAVQIPCRYIYFWRLSEKSSEVFCGKVAWSEGLFQKNGRMQGGWKGVVLEPGGRFGG